MDRRSALRLGVAGGVVGMVGSAGHNASAEPNGAEALADAALVRSLPVDFHDGHARVNGTRLHYVIGGRGAPLVLLPGWPQTWWQFRKIMPELASTSG